MGDLPLGTSRGAHDAGGRPLELPPAQGRGLATAQRVHAACDHLLAKGARITEPAIREIVGGGSKTSIYAHIETWYGRLQDELRELRAATGRSAFPNLPAPLVDALTETWRFLATEADRTAAAAVQAAQQSLQSDRDAFADEMLREKTRLADERSRWATERDALVSSRDQALRAHAAERERATELTSALAIAEERLVRASEEATSTQTRIRELNAMLADANDRYARDTAAMLVRFDAERHALTKDLATANASRAQSDTRALQEREARLSLTAERSTLNARLAETIGALDAARAELGNQTLVATQAQAQVNALRAELAAATAAGASLSRRSLRKIPTKRKPRS